MAAPYTVPAMPQSTAERVATILQGRLDSILDLALTLKHIHWNVTGPGFIAVHQMLDDQVGPVREMADDLAERIATIGGEPRGTPAGITERRTWEDYGVGRAPVETHLTQLDTVYEGIISSHREAQMILADLDPVTEDLIIGHLAKLELYQWFVRSHLEDRSG